MARAPFSVSERATKHGVAWDGAVIKTIRIADAKNRSHAIRVPLTYFSRMHRLPNPLQYLDKLAENERERYPGLPRHENGRAQEHGSSYTNCMMTDRYSNHDTLIDFNDARQKLEDKLRTEERKRQEKEAEKVASRELADGENIVTDVAE